MLVNYFFVEENVIEEVLNWMAMLTTLQARSMVVTIGKS